MIKRVVNKKIINKACMYLFHKSVNFHHVYVSIYLGIDNLRDANDTCSMI